MGWDGMGRGLVVGGGGGGCGCGCGLEVLLSNQRSEDCEIWRVASERVA